MSNSAAHSSKPHSDKNARTSARTSASRQVSPVNSIVKGQPDLHYGGTFFSLMVIYLLNLVLLAAMLILASPQVTWAGFGKELLQNTIDFTASLTIGLNQILRAFLLRSPH